MLAQPISIIAVVAIGSGLVSSVAGAQTLAGIDGNARLSISHVRELETLQVPDLKSEGAAFRYSLLGTLVPVALGTVLAASGSDNASESSGTAAGLLIYAGVYVGPSLGYFYAGKPARGMASFGLRNAFGLAAVLGVYAVCNPFDCDEGEAQIAGAIAFVGSLGILASAMYDIMNVRKTVRERNEETLASRLAVIPTYSRRDGPGVQVSLAVR